MRNMFFESTRNTSRAKKRLLQSGRKRGGERFFENKKNNFTRNKKNCLENCQIRKLEIFVPTVGWDPPLGLQSDYCQLPFPLSCIAAQKHHHLIIKTSSFHHHHNHVISYHMYHHHQILPWYSLTNANSLGSFPLSCIPAQKHYHNFYKVVTRK